MVETRAQRRKRMAWDTVESEQGVLMDILARLPVKSVRSFRRINRYWYGSVRNRYFAKMQLGRSRENPAFIACQIRDSKMKLYSMKPGSFKLSYVNRINPPERSDEGQMHVVSSFNGLLCCINQIWDDDVENQLCDLQIWICNPCTRETLFLPQGSPSYEFVPSVGVAYYSDINEYKLFRIFCTGKKSREDRVFDESDTEDDGMDIEDDEMVANDGDALAYECEVYSSMNGSWKNIGPVPCAPCKVGHVFVNGKIYWLSSFNRRDIHKILSVDLSERFETISLPQYPDGLHADDGLTESIHLINLSGALAMVVIHPEYMDIWEWKEGDKKWVLDYVDDTPISDFEIVLAMTSSENQIIIMTEARWYSFDVVEGSWKKKTANSARFENCSVFPFTESVLPCNGGGVAL